MAVNHRLVSFIRRSILIGLVLMAAACHESRHLAEGQTLYTANEVKVQSSVPLSHHRTKELKADLNQLLRPNLNGKILGIRFKLWVYNIAGTPKKKKGFKHWLKYKVGEPPVLSTPKIIEKNREILQNHLENKGYFWDTVLSATPVKDKHLTAVYTAQIGTRYTIRNITFPPDSDDLSRRIDSLQHGSLLKKGDGFDLDVIKDERTRIDGLLKNKGYYFFSPDDLFADVDSALGNHQVDLHLRVKLATPLLARNVYRINEVVVYANYGILTDTSLRKAYTTPEGYHIVDSAHILRPVIFSRTMVVKPGDIYNRDDHNRSLSRLVSLGVFGFVKLRFEPLKSDDSSHLLNAFYYLTPAQKKSLQFEVTGLTRSDNTTGTELSINWRHRNLFRGAELFTAKLYGGLEEQYIVSTGSGSSNQNNQKNQKVNVRRAGLDLSLYIPRIISPFNLNTSSAYVPKTKIEADYDIFDQSSEYTLTSSKVSFGYVFKNNQTTENTITVLGIDYVRPSNINPNFQLGLDTNITLARAIEKTFIIGPTYNFNYNSQAKPNKNTNNYYFNGNVDLSNNILGLVTGANINKGKQVDIFNVPFAQYVRLEADFRHYLRFDDNSMLASRITSGVGFAYGNSTTMPFVKEFFAGGTNDIRAFRSRALGPGSYYAGNPNTTQLLPDQPGDFKLEGNVEYRGKLSPLVNWALYVDAGNVWTLKADTSRPGSQLTPGFLKDIAVGIGTGLRFDLSILVLRIDVAVPVRYPWLPDGHKWDFPEAADISNMVLNLAIGYPF
jgi:outer membrane protein insertion porin family